jgi:phosphoglycolate phosphatase-like HAD superfamily hydrolase
LHCSDVQQKLILFDLDSTLVNLDRYYVMAFARAMREVFGVDEGFDLTKSQGNTIAQIVRCTCHDLGIPARLVETRLDDVVRLYGEAAVALFEDDLHWAVLPGVASLLEALRDGGHALGLVTGSIAATGRVVLERSVLQACFPVCVCGDEGDEKLELLRLATQRATAAYHLPQVNGLVVVGDSVRDVRAGRQMGAWMVAVATGQHSPERLAQEGVNVVLPNLADWRVALVAILHEHQDLQPLQPALVD